MKTFHCDHCQSLAFFENTSCTNCKNKLAFLPDQGIIGSLEPADKEGLWRSPKPAKDRKRYRLCENYSRENVCNWAIPESDPNPLCTCCRLTQTIPDLSQPGYKAAWCKLENAKRRLVFSLLKLGFPVIDKVTEPETGLRFDFLADQPDKPPILTGHDNGMIVINIAEADDSERERRRNLLHEPYRTLLGHFRHEVGHYYWDRLIANTPRIEEFRKVFGDERASYEEALKRNYADGPSANWQESYVSSYASVHPWEDWAESFAHYMHIIDALGTASATGVTLKPCRPDEPTIHSIPDPLEKGTKFQSVIENWNPLAYLLNGLNRSMGLQDAYPFVLSAPAISKLEFIHNLAQSLKQPEKAALRIAPAPKKAQPAALAS